MQFPKGRPAEDNMCNLHKRVFQVVTNVTLQWGSRKLSFVVNKDCTETNKGRRKTIITQEHLGSP